MVRNPARKESVSSVCSQEVTARFTSASVAQSLATEVVLKGSKGMWINRRKASIALLPVTVLRYDTLTVFYPVCITTWKIYLCPFTRRNLRLRTVFHVGWADTLFLKLHFVWVLKVTQLWRVVRPCIASDTVCLIYTKRRASDTSALRLIAFLYYKIKRTRIPPNFVDTESSLSCSQQLTAFPYPELEKSTSLQSISYIYIYIIPIYAQFFQVVSFLQIFILKIHMKFYSDTHTCHTLCNWVIVTSITYYHFNYVLTELGFLVSDSCGFQIFFLCWK